MSTFVCLCVCFFFFGYDKFSYSNSIHGVETCPWGFFQMIFMILNLILWSVSDEKYLCEVRWRRVKEGCMWSEEKKVKNGCVLVLVVRCLEVRCLCVQMCLWIRIQCNSPKSFIYFFTFHLFNFYFLRLLIFFFFTFLNQWLRLKVAFCN